MASRKIGHSPFWVPLPFFLSFFSSFLFRFYADRPSKRNGKRRAVKIARRDCAVILLGDRRALRASRLASARQWRTGREIVFLILPDKSAVTKQVLTFPCGRPAMRPRRRRTAVCGGRGLERARSRALREKMGRGTAKIRKKETGKS